MASSSEASAGESISSTDEVPGKLGDFLSAARPVWWAWVAGIGFIVFDLFMWALSDALQGITREVLLGVIGILTLLYAINRTRAEMQRKW